MPVPGTPQRDKCKRQKPWLRAGYGPKAHLNARNAKQNQCVYRLREPERAGNFPCCLAQKAKADLINPRGRI